MVSAALVAGVIFAVAYVLVVSEDLIGLRKSVPVLLAAGSIWALVALDHGGSAEVAEWVRENLHDFAEIFLFLVSAVAYISAIGKRNVFKKLGAGLVAAGFGLRSLFWVTGALTFLLSPIADNLTTALLMGAVVVTLAPNDRRFVGTACTNIVVAANAGGAFSPFGDITTLMVWQAGHVPTLAFGALILPAIVSWLVPAAVMHFAIPDERAPPVAQDVTLDPDWWIVVILFLMTILTAVTFFGVLGLPPFLGMTTGLGYYLLYCYAEDRRRGHAEPGIRAFADIASVEWDTLIFFFGVIMCVGGLAAFGFLETASKLVYDGLGTTWANIGIGLASAVLDNVPVMFAVLTMGPEMPLDQWLLVTLTTGIGGSALSVGSAAGVALMGATGGQYTFTQHLRWTPVILVGYAAGVAAHLLLTAGG